MTLAKIRAKLQEAHQALAAIRDSNLQGVSADTGIALGELIGAIRRAEALVARDMNNQHLAQGPRHG